MKGAGTAIAQRIVGRAAPYSLHTDANNRPVTVNLCKIAAFAARQMGKERRRCLVSVS
jgi:hypothetical protein